MKMRMKVSTLKAILALLVLAIMAAMAIAAPYGPDTISRDNDQRRTNFDGGVKQIEAQAGNVTQLTINTTILTERWQGYYGNISGKVTLDDANGYTMYDWSAGSGFAPVGEIYAANQSISSWGDVVCLNLTGNGVVGQDGPNTTILETMYGMDVDDADGVDETFTGTKDIVIGTTTLTSCPATNMYVNNVSQSALWNETLLLENNTAVSTVIFAAQTEQNANGFNNQTWDFQMIVGDNGEDAIATIIWKSHV